jgi:ATP/maltotriose-dependent transcriptional regulator MalT
VTARLLEPLNAALARETHLEALTVAMYVGDAFLPGGVPKAADAVRSAPPAPYPPRPVDVALDAFALLLTEGYATAAPVLKRAVDLLLALDVGTSEGRRWRFLAGGRVGMIIALERYDLESLHVLTAGQAQAAREVGALVQLRTATMGLAAVYILQGELSAAARLIGEARLTGEATLTPPDATAALLLAAWRGREQEASELIEATVREGTVREHGFVVAFANSAAAMLYNGLGGYGAAREAAWRAWECRPPALGPFAVPELAEAAARTGEVALVRAALEWLSERIQAFAERARRELLATGETVRKRSAETASELTDREAHIARLAVEGRTNTEIGAQLFLSGRTVEWHLRNVYAKLGVGSRRELRSALANVGQPDAR